MTTLIDTSTLTKIGNMTTNGIAYLFDGSTGTNAYSAATTGYAGVALSASTKISYAEIDSQTNGFDASGSTTSITLKLYGKTGSVPSSGTDGTLLCTVGPFTDVNSLNTKTLTSSDQTTLFDYVWIYVSTGVWSAAVELRFYAVDSVPEPTEVTETDVSTVFLRSCNDRVACTRAGNLVSQFSIPFKLNEARKVKIDLKCDFKYLTVSGYNDVIVVSASLQHRTDSTALALQSATWTISQRAAGGGNILNVTDHYLTVPLIDVLELDAGYHEIIVGVSAGTTANSYDNLAEILAEGASAPYFGRNLLRVEVMPEGTVVYDLT